MRHDTPSDDRVSILERKKKKTKNEKNKKNSKMKKSLSICGATIAAF